ncbi:MAG: hypothetical protein ACRECY_19470, partial [Phyllobacterium sp.]
MGKVTRRQLLKGIGTTALLAAFPESSAADQQHHFWPGSRIGIKSNLPDFMYPYAGNPYNLHSYNDNWSVIVSEQPAIDALYDADIWDRKKYVQRDKLLRTIEGPDNLEMRLFARMVSDGDSLRDLGERTLVMRHSDWFGKIDLLCRGPLIDTDTSHHWSTFELLTSSIFNSLIVRGPISVKSFLAENGLEMNLS